MSFPTPEYDPSEHQVPLSEKLEAMKAGAHKMREGMENLGLKQACDMIDTAVLKLRGSGKVIRV